MIYKTDIQKYLCKKFWIRHRILIHIVALSCIVFIYYIGFTDSIKIIILLSILFLVLYHCLIQAETLKYIYSKNNIVDDYFDEQNQPSNEYILDFLLNKSPVAVYYEGANHNILYKNEQAKFFLDTYNEKEFQSDFNIKNAIKIQKTFKNNHNTSKFNIYKYPICDENQNNVIIGTIAQDISIPEIIKQEREMYIAIIMHDLKTPVLAQIRIIKKMLDDKNITDKEQIKLLELTLESCNYVYSMLSVFLNTCKLANKTQLNYEEWDLKLLLEISCEKLHSNMVDKNIKFNISSTQTQKNILGDKSQLLFAISSLLKLSLNYSGSNSSIFVNLYSDKYENHTLEIISTGSTFNTSLLENLLQDDITDTSKYNKIGEGLELYLTQQIIKAHNGNITVENNTEEKKNIIIKFEKHEVKNLHK